MADNPKNNLEISEKDLRKLVKSIISENDRHNNNDDFYARHLSEAQANVQRFTNDIDYLDKKINNIRSNREAAQKDFINSLDKSDAEYRKSLQSLEKINKKYYESLTAYASKTLKLQEEKIKEADILKAKKSTEDSLYSIFNSISSMVSDLSRTLDDEDEEIISIRNKLKVANEKEKALLEEQLEQHENTRFDILSKKQDLQKIQLEALAEKDRAEAMRQKNEEIKKEKEELEIKRKNNLISQQDYDMRIEELGKSYSNREIAKAELQGAFSEGSPIQGISAAVKQLASGNSPIYKGISIIGEGVKNLVKIVDKIASQGISEAMNLAGEYLGSIDARLQGTPLLDNGQGFGMYERLNQSLIRSFAASPFINQKELMQNINRFVDQGISWNVEQRALITTLSEKMVTTFDALDASLTRLIRVQGADLTASSMGAEAQLTKFLNTNFQDTSYLNSLYDSVNAAVLDASAQLNYEGAIGFNYAVQKWLASLYSVGMSESGVQTIAQGLNYLATGNADALAGNASLQNLLALSATNAGLNYADLLKTGLNADKTDMLLESMVRYLQGIYSNIGNNVVKSAWSNIAGLSVTDLRSISNLSQTEISNIASSDITYGNALTEFKNQLSKVEERTTIQEMANTLLDNVMLSFGNTLIGTANGDGTWSASGDFSSISDLLSNIVPYITWNIGEKTGGTFGAVSKLASLASNLFGDIFQSEEEADKYSVWDLASTLVSQYQDNYLSPTQGLEFLWNPQVSDNPWFFNEKTNALTLKDRALNYIPLLGAVASSDMKQLTSSGTDLGTSTNELSTMVGEAAAAANKALSSTSSSSGMSEGTSFAMTNASTESERSMSLSNNDLVSAETSAVTGASNEITTRTVYDLYEKLFEKRDVPIRVQLAEIEEVVTKSLQQYLISDMANDVKYLANQAAGTGINVDLGAEDASLMKSQIYSVKYL